MSYSRIQMLRQMAKLNFPDECYQIYLAMIEPGLEALIREYLGGWQSLESRVTVMVMRERGVFKSHLDITYIDPEGKEDGLTKDVDIKAYHEIRKWPFRRKIEYLLKLGLIGPNLFELLKFVGQRRNRIHDYGGLLSQDDLDAFQYSFSLVFQMYVLARPNDFSSERRRAMENQTESAAEEVLKALKKIDQKVSRK